MSAHDTPEVGSGETAGGRYDAVADGQTFSGVRCELCGVVRMNAMESVGGVVRCQDRHTCDQVVGLVADARSTFSDLVEAGWKPASPDPVQPADAGDGLSEAERALELAVNELLLAKGWAATGNDIARGVLASDWLAAREAAWAEKYAAVAGERDRARLSRDATKAAMVRQIRSRKSAEAALATALREKADVEAEVARLRDVVASQGRARGALSQEVDALRAALGGEHDA